MTIRVALAAAVAAAAAAFDLPVPHVRGGGMGMWGAMKSWLHGSGVLDLRPGAADSCCAMHRDGSYYANFSALADWGDGITPSFGTIGMDAQGNNYVARVGGTCVEDSDFGVYLRPEGDALVATAWCGEARKCVDHFFAKGALLPRMCFGGDDSMWPDYISSSRIDAMLTANNFADVTANHFISANRLTCMPLYSLHRFNTSDDDDGASPLMRAGGMLLPRPPRSVLNRARGAESSESWAAVLFLNATGTPPPDDVFDMPSYCSDDAARRRAPAPAAN